MRDRCRAPKRRRALQKLPRSFREGVFAKPGAFSKTPSRKLRGGGAPKGAPQAPVSSAFALAGCGATTAGRAFKAGAPPSDAPPVAFLVPVGRASGRATGRLAALPGTGRLPPPLLTRRVQPLKAAGRNAGGRLAGASRVRGYEPRPQAPPLPHVQRASAERPSLGGDSPRII